MELELIELRERVEVLEKTLQEMNNLVKRKFELVFTFFNNEIDLSNKFQDERSMICQNFYDELNSIPSSVIFNSSSRVPVDHQNTTRSCDDNGEICRSPIVEVETELTEPMNLNNIKVEGPHFEADESDSILPNLENDEDNRSITRNNDFLLASSSLSTSRASDSNHSHCQGQGQHFLADNSSFQSSQSLPLPPLINFNTALYNRLSKPYTPPDSQIPTVVKQKVRRAKVAKTIIPTPVLENRDNTNMDMKPFYLPHITHTRPNRKKRKPIKRRFPTNEKRSSIWSHFNQVIHGSEEMAKCVYCESLQQPRTDRLRIHLRHHGFLNTYNTSPAPAPTKKSKSSNLEK